MVSIVPVAHCSSQTDLKETRIRNTLGGKKKFFSTAGRLLHFLVLLAVCGRDELTGLDGDLDGREQALSEVGFQQIYFEHVPPNAFSLHLPLNSPYISD